MKAKTKKTLKKVYGVGLFLALVGAVNWGLVGFFDFNLVSYLLGDFSKYVYMLVGIFGVWGLFKMFK